MKFDLKICFHSSKKSALHFINAPYKIGDREAIIEQAIALVSGD
ncbi:MAG: hypothetical protein NW214_04680 [Pseudanabaenaceae cyanobacterium bins.39]|nr:hypothetical protein [Pseudanabaenaceae cyanobacterium bins.39]